MAVYTLPDLPYDYAALEPAISAKIMTLHHDKHHKAYVDGANTALDKLAAAREADDFCSIVGLQKTLAFNVAGHINHSLFWQNLGPAGQGQPDGDLGAALKDSFGSFEAFQAHFTAAATTVQGSGWVGLFHDQVSGGLLIQQMQDHQTNVGPGNTPLYIMDMWEHAFYLDYLNVKADYVKAFWTIINWQDVATRFSASSAA